MTLYFHSDSVRSTLLHDARHRFQAASNQQAVIETVRETARKVCNADGITFVLRDGEQCHYVEEDAIGPLWKGQKFPLSACISGWAMLNAKTAVIEDVFADPRIPYDAYLPTFVKSLIMTPVGEKHVAAMGAYWKETRHFSEEEVAIVQNFAAMVGETLSRLLGR
jgi:GAF domain-containing protein